MTPTGSQRLVVRLGEVNVIGTDLARMRSFYCDLLGLEPVEQEGDLALHCSLGGVRFLLLAVAEGPSRAGAYGSAATMSFDLLCDDLAEMCRRLEAAGAAFSRPYDGRTAHVLDPDGNVVELIAHG